MFSVIMVDDDPEDIYVLKRALEKAGVEVSLSTYTNPSLFIRDLKERNLALPDVLLLDINMPNVSGYQIIEKVRNDNSFQHLPIIMLTTSSLKADKEKCGSLGATDFATKPTSLSEMTEFIDYLMGFLENHKNNEH